MGPGVWEILKESIKEELVNEIKEYRSDIELKQAVLNTYIIIIENSDVQPHIAPLTMPNGNIDF
ncbi:MAG: hypothetical protein AB8V03_00875 [Francisella endosymbiont of Hyalomma asiaticum]